MENREFDIVVWGATGFTGKLVTAYLWEKYGNNNFRWAIAGRDEKKLKEVSAEFGLKAIPFVLADSFDLESLKKMAGQTKVVCTTVGPYIKYGDGLVRACIEEGTHYCDLTGEVPWMKKIIDLYHEKAGVKKLKIVHACGFDSIPSDIGVRKIQQEFFKKYGYYAGKVSTRITDISGGLSGGTYSSMMNMMEMARKDADFRRIVSNMYALNPDPDYAGADKKEFKSVRRDILTDSWLCPFIMAGINTKIVRRSHALEGFRYGENFSYEEAMVCGKGVKGRLRAIIFLLGLGMLMKAKSGSFLKKIIDRKMPHPGDGPDKKTREAGYFRFLIFAEGKGSDRIVLAVQGYKDPGYGSTSSMLAESALSLLEGETLPQIYGVLTPSVAMGDILERRLDGEIDFLIDKTSA